MARKRGFHSGRRLLLAVAAMSALAGPIAIGAVNAAPERAQSQPTTRPAVDVASVKIHKADAAADRRYVVSYGSQGINFGALTLGFMIGEAYDFPVGRIVFPDSLPKEILLGSLGDGYDGVAKGRPRCSARPASTDAPVAPGGPLQVGAASGSKDGPAV